jgi:hypothetical protein
MDIMSPLLETWHCEACDEDESMQLSVVAEVYHMLADKGVTASHSV